MAPNNRSNSKRRTQPVSTTDWSAVASSVLEHIQNPTALIHRDRRILRVNSAFVQLVGKCAGGIEGRSYCDVVAHDKSELCDYDLVEDSGRRLRSGPLFSTPMWLRVEISPTAANDSDTFVLQIVESEQDKDGSDMSMTCDNYVVSSSHLNRGMLLATENERDFSSKKVGAYCYEVIGRSSEPCPGCPVFDGPCRFPARRALTPANGYQGYRVIEVNEDDEERLNIKSVRLSGTVLSELVQAKMEWVAAEGGLSSRESEVLNLLYVGRSMRDIAMLLEISERTVKYHQANVLRKLGADSRVDLVRLLL